MGIIRRVLCQILFFHGALQCYQARLEFSDQGFGDVDDYLPRTYQQPNDEVEVSNTDFMGSSPDNEGKDTNREELETEGDEITANDKEASNVYEDSEEKSEGNLHWANAEKRRISKRERKRNKHLNKLHHQNKDSPILETSSETEHTSHDRETAHFYLTKPSDIANMSAMLGPGPIPIPVQIQYSTSKKPATSAPNAVNSSTNTRTENDRKQELLQSTVKNTKLGSENVNNVAANISLKSDDIVSLVAEPKRGYKRKFKSHNGREMNGGLIPKKQPKKESRMFHKQLQKYEPSQGEVMNTNTKYETRRGEGMNTNPKIVHKKRKHKQMHNEPAINTKKDVDKYRLNEKEQYTNLSAINKSFQKAAIKKFELKNRGNNPTEIESKLDNEDNRIEIDQINNEDANKISLLNSEREINEEESSLRDEAAELEKENGNLNTRRKPGKGIRSKIEHGDWVNQVTLLPLPDYSVRKNKTHNKDKLSSTEIQKKPLKGDFSSNEKKRTDNKKHKRKKSVNFENVASLVETSNQIQDGSESDKEMNEEVSDTLLQNGEETENKRDERDTKRKVESNNFDNAEERSIFNQHSDTSDENSNEMYDMDMKQDEQAYSNINRNEHAKRKQEVSEKSEDEYEYDSQLVGDEKSNTEGGIENRTLLTTRSTYASTTDIVQSIKPTKKPNKPKTTLKRNNKSQENPPQGGIGNGIVQVNETVDPYEMFLCGKLADDFVTEVLRKVKRSRKLSRELGYSNETEETCDRCIELKPIKVPELTVIKNSLEKCLKSSKPVQNCFMCCGVPKPMMRYLNTLVYFEQENENSFYNKIQDDSTFIFTGDYGETLSKGENGMKINEKYEDERSSFNKETFDRQRLREDVNEEKSEGKGANSNSFERHENKFSTVLQNSAEDVNTENENLRRSKEGQGEVKRNLGKFGKIKLTREKERNFPGLDEDMKENNFETKLNVRNPALSVKEYISNKEATYPHHTRQFGKERKDYLNEKLEAAKSRLNTPQNPRKSPNENFDRYYGKSNYDYFKQYPSKVSTDYKTNNDNSMMKNPPLKVSRDRDGFYNIQNSNAMSNTGDEKYNFQNNYFGYPPKKYIERKNLNQNANDKGYQSKYDFSYEDNGEYSLYPHLESTNPEEDVNRMSGNYKINEGDNSRMVKRHAETLPMYDDEPSVFFEVPNIEYDLYK